MNAAAYAHTNASGIEREGEGREGERAPKTRRKLEATDYARIRVAISALGAVMSIWDKEGYAFYWCGCSHRVLLLCSGGGSASRGQNANCIAAASMCQRDSDMARQAEAG